MVKSPAGESIDQHIEEGLRDELLDPAKDPLGLDELARPLARNPEKQPSPEGLPKGAERRETERLTVDDPELEVLVRDSQSFVRMYLQDISRGGLFVKTSRSFSIGEKLEITLAVHPRTGAPPRSFRVSGTVVRALSSGVGVKFEAIDPEVQSAIEAYIGEVRKRTKSAGPQRPKSMPTPARESSGISSMALLLLTVVGLLIAWATYQAFFGKPIAVQSESFIVPIQSAIGVKKAPTVTLSDIGIKLRPNRKTEEAPKDPHEEK